MPDFPIEFDLGQLTRSATAARLGLDNTPDDAAVANLARLANTVLMPVRALAGQPLVVDDAYRTPAVNAADGGVPTSQHELGLAADIRPLQAMIDSGTWSIERLFDLVRGPAGVAVPFDQLILESGCVHISAAPEGTAPRRDVLVRSGTPGHWRYEAPA